MVVEVTMVTVVMVVTTAVAVMVSLSESGACGHV
jgi:hypothetical protein